MRNSTLKILMVMVVLCVFGARGDDWPRFGGPGGNGISIEGGWEDGGLQEVWRAEVGVGFSSFAVSGGRVYTMGNAEERDTVWCLDTATGEVVWEFGYGAPLEDRLFEGGPTATPTVDGGEVFTVSRMGDVYCLDAATGEVKWQRQLLDETEVRQPGWGFGGSAVVVGDVGGVVLINAGENGVGLDRKSGEILWASADKEAGYCTPVIYGDGKKAVLANSRYFVGIDIKSGEKLWQHRWLTRYGVHAASPVVVGDGKVLIASGYGKGAALLDVSNEADVVEVWKSKELRTQLNGCVLIDGYLYGIDGDAESDAALRCVDAKTGVTVWSEEGFGFGSLFGMTPDGDVEDGRLVLLTEGGELVVAKASAEGYAELGRAKILDGKCWTVPVLANGKIYARDADGVVVCLNPGVKIKNQEAGSKK